DKWVDKLTKIQNLLGVNFTGTLYLKCQLCQPPLPLPVPKPAARRAGLKKRRDYDILNGIPWEIFRLQILIPPHCTTPKKHSGSSHEKDRSHSVQGQVHGSLYQFFQAPHARL
ncbi:MAG: hypothetical protein MJ078_09180, partial [Clostridia bacterium]|nr:hypothetical protein [Clostridia bacterium]